MVALVFDLIAVALVLVMIIVSARKGFLSGLLSFIGWIVSAFVAKTFCTIISNFVYNSLLKSRIYTAILTALDGHRESLSSSYTDLINSLPAPIQSLLGSTDISSLDSILADTSSSLETVATKINEEIVGPVVMTMLTAISFIIIFLICMLVVKLFVKLFKGVKKIPVIGPINTFLGGVIGVAEAVIVLFIIKISIDFVTTAAGGNLFGLTLDDFSNSYIFQFFNFRGLL